jgi:hypothetical protein
MTTRRTQQRSRRRHRRAPESSAAGIRDQFENAHRVDVTWATNSTGRFLTFDIPEIGGT